MSKQRYNCVWGVDFLPTRTEAYVLERDTNKWIMQEFNIIIENSEEAVIQFMSKNGIVIFNYTINKNILNGRTTISYAGKGKTNE
jgi:hypothetical protein